MKSEYANINLISIKNTGFLQRNALNRGPFVFEKKFKKSLEKI
jgi:hypothetical protein